MTKIVIVEDEPLLLKALNIELLSAKFTAISAIDGDAAWKAIRDQKPDLVLLDLVLPKLSGFEVLRIMKENADTKNIPVIVLSNLSQKEDMLRALSLGADDFFIKSNTDLDQIVDKIKSLLKSKKKHEKKVA
jgi:DNA-binding response OmpR family regulator